MPLTQLCIQLSQNQVPKKIYHGGEDADRLLWRVPPPHCCYRNAPTCSAIETITLWRRQLWGTSPGEQDCAGIQLLYILPASHTSANHSLPKYALNPSASDAYVNNSMSELSTKYCKLLKEQSSHLQIHLMLCYQANKLKRALYTCASAIRQLSKHPMGIMRHAKFNLQMKDYSCCNCPFLTLKEAATVPFRSSNLSVGRWLSMATISNFIHRKLITVLGPLVWSGANVIPKQSVTCSTVYSKREQAVDSMWANAEDIVQIMQKQIADYTPA